MMEIKQLIPADGWYVIRRDFESEGLPTPERVWHYPFHARPLRARFLPTCVKPRVSQACPERLACVTPCL